MPLQRTARDAGHPRGLTESQPGWGVFFLHGPTPLCSTRCLVQRHLGSSRHPEIAIHAHLAEVVLRHQSFNQCSLILHVGGGEHLPALLPDLPHFRLLG
jgi:hypothetical protein